MPVPAPIVESIKGDLSFLLGPDGPEGHLHVRWRDAEFPTVANMQTVLRVLHESTPKENDRYGLIRVTNNLAAAHICVGDLAAAWDALSEAQEALVHMIQGSPGPDSKLAVNFAVLKYNESVLMRQRDDTDGARASERSRNQARQALGQVAEGGTNDSARFVVVALSRLG